MKCKSTKKNKNSLNQTFLYVFVDTISNILVLNFNLQAGNNWSPNLHQEITSQSCVQNCFLSFMSNRGAVRQCYIFCFTVIWKKEKDVLKERRYSLVCEQCCFITWQHFSFQSWQLHTIIFDIIHKVMIK